MEQGIFIDDGRGFALSRDPLSGCQPVGMLGMGSTRRWRQLLLLVGAITIFAERVGHAPNGGQPFLRQTSDH